MKGGDFAVKKVIPILLVLALLLTSCSFAEKIGDIPKADEVSRIRIASFGSGGGEIRGKDFGADEVETVLDMLRDVELQYDSSDPIYGGVWQHIRLYDGENILLKEYVFSENFSLYAVYDAETETLSYYKVLSGSEELSALISTD